MQIPVAPAVMGILNVTPDSFSDGGCYVNLDTAMCQVKEMVEAGVDIIDIGGESTRPGAQSVSTQQELDRVIPVIQAIHSQHEIMVSIDTSKPTVMEQAVLAGAGMINDVCALSQDGAMQAAASLKVPVCLMHMQGSPRTMQENPQYNDVCHDVTDWLAQRMEQCVDSGIMQENILLDPGFGFGKSLEHNLSLFTCVKAFARMGAGVVVGVSRKSMFSQLLNLPLNERDTISTVAAALAWNAGARIVRVHDTKHAIQARDFICAYSDAKGAITNDS